MSIKYDFDFEEVSVYANVVDLITRRAKAGSTHIDLGCGNAAIAGALMSQGIHYLGFDGDAKTVERLKARGLEAYQVDLDQTRQAIDEIFARLGDRPIDSLSMIDVLEHLNDGAALLKVIAEESRRRGHFILVLSVPNFAHADVATKLISGIWDYTDTGLLDRTHRIIYTEDNLRKLTRSAGWRESAICDYRLEHTEQSLLPGPDRYHATGGTELLLRQIKRQVDGQYNVYQFVRSLEAMDEASPEQLPSQPVVSFLVTSKSDLHILLKLVSEEAFYCVSTIPLQLVLTPELADSEIAPVPPSIDVYRLAPSEPLEPVLTGRHVLAIKAAAGWNSTALADAVDWLASQHPHGVVHAGGGGTPDDEPLSRWSTLARELTDSTLGRCFLPCDYFRHHKEPVITEDGSIQRAEQLLRIAARTGVRHFSFLTENADYSRPLPELWELVELLGPATACQAFVFDGHLPPGLATLKEKIAELEHDLASTHQSLSWKVTRPLRMVRRLASLVRRLAAVDWTSSKSRQEVIAKIRRRIAHVAHRLQNWVMARSSSRHNLEAIQALSARRFDNAHFLPSQLNAITELPAIDVSVVTYNSEKWVDNFFESLTTQCYPLDKLNVVIVDHGSSDATVGKLTEWQQSLEGRLASVQIIEQANLGFGAGHERAINAGRSAYCLVTNLDLEFPPESLIKVVQAAQANEGQRVASWELRQIPYEHPKYYDPVTLETNWSSHACILISRAAFEEVGGYDHHIFMYAEDVELSYRFRSHGYALKYVPDATVRHFTYKHAGEIKPLQFTGSILGNTYIRLRYGEPRDIVIGLMMHAFRLVGPEPFSGARRLLWKNLRTLAGNSRHFLGGKGSSQACFPLRGFDYEMIRDGAFWEISEPDGDSASPRVSIITRTYRGRGALLEQAIRTVFNQTYPAIELLVVEDGGDTQKALVEKMASLAPRHVSLRFITNPKLGRSAAGNTGLANASGQFMMFLDDDDLLFADHVETLVAPMLNDVTLSATYSLAFEVATDLAADKSSYMEKGFLTHNLMRQEWDYAILQDHNFIPIQAILFRRELFEEHGGFDVDLDQLEDWNLWLRYGYRKQFKFIPKTTSYYRVPADPTVLAARHQLLHAAYEKARSRALRTLDKVNGQ